MAVRRSRPRLSFDLSTLSDWLASERAESDGLPPLSDLLPQRQAQRAVIDALASRKQFFFGWVGVNAKAGRTTGTGNDRGAWEIRVKTQRRKAAVKVDTARLKRERPELWTAHRSLKPSVYVAAPERRGWNAPTVDVLADVPFPAAPPKVAALGCRWARDWDEVNRYAEGRELRDFAELPPREQWMSAGTAKLGYEAYLAAEKEAQATLRPIEQGVRTWLHRAVNDEWDGTEVTLSDGWIIRVKEWQFSSTSALNDPSIKPYLLTTPEKVVPVPYIHYTDIERRDLGDGRGQWIIGGEPDEIDGD